MKFVDQEGDNVYLEFKTNEDIAQGQHVLVIPIYKQQFLFTKHKQRGIEFPGGKLEYGESSVEGMKRELFEETGAEVATYYYIAQYRVERTNGQPFSKDVFVVEVSEIHDRKDYLETEGPIVKPSLSAIPDDEKSYLLADDAILQCVARGRELGLYNQAL